MTLAANSLITVELLAGIQATDTTVMTSNFESYFTTTMYPLYSSAFEVRRIIGAFVDEIPDDIINQLILEHSLLAEDLALCDNLDAKWERFTGRWVLYKVALIILYNSDEFKGSSADKVFKQLGDFSVSKQGGSSENTGLNKLISWLECEIFKYEIAVRNCTVPAISCAGMDDPDTIADMSYSPSLAQVVERGAQDTNKPIAGRQWVSTIWGRPRGNNTLFYNNRKYRTNLGTW